MTTPGFDPPIHAPRHTRKGFARTLAGTLAASIAIAGLAFSAVAPAEAAPKTTVVIGTAATLTLPSNDGFRDESVVRISSNKGITVQVDIIEAATKKIVGHAATALRLKKDGDRYRGSVRLSVAKFEAKQLGKNGDGSGRYSLRVRSTASSSISDSTPFAIGSGEATQATVSTTESTLYPYPDDYRETLHAKVTAKDETGTILPITGLLRVFSGDERRDATVASDEGTPASVKVSVAKILLGTGQVKAKVSGPSGDALTTKPVTLKFAATSVTKVAAKPTTPTVYPVKDGYADSVGIAFATNTTIPRDLEVTGVITVSRNGTTVKKWTVTSSKSATFSWDGRVKGKVVTGTFDIKAAVKGPQGPLVRSATTVKVSKKKLVQKTVSTWRSADRVLTEFSAYDANKDGACVAKSGRLTCTGLDVSRDSTLSLYSWGSVTVPAAVRSTAKYETPSVRIVADTRAVKGTVSWAYGHRSHKGELEEGTYSLGWLPLNGNPKSVTVSASLGKRAATTIDRFRVDYRYSVLQ